jgi:tetratricopeptide (TPR) repeat protein
MMRPMREIASDELEPIVAQLRRGRAVLCAGGELGADGSLRRLIGKLMDLLPDPSGARALLENRPLMAADHVRRRLGPQFSAALQQATASAQVGEVLRLLGGLPFTAVVTTSYDSAVERAFARDGALPPVFTPTDSLAPPPPRSHPVFKLLGDPAREETVVWGAEDLQRALARGGYRAVADPLFRTRSFLLLGFEWGDAELGLLLERVLSGVRSDVDHYAVLPNLGPIEREELYAIYRIRVLAEEDPTRLARGLHAAMSDPARALPDDADGDAWLALLAEDPGRADALQKLERLEDTLRQRADWEGVIGLTVGHAAIEASAARRANLLDEAARLFEHELNDPARAFTTRLAAYREAPRRAAWDELERLAASLSRWPELATELRALQPELPPADRGDAWLRLAAMTDEELGDPVAALADVDAALALDPGSAPALAQRTALLERLERWKELSETLGRRVFAEDSLARKAELYRELGALFDARLGDPVQAIACYRLAIETDPWAQEARTALEALYFRRGEHGALVQLLEEKAARTTGPEQDLLRRRIAELCADHLGDRPLAIRHYEAILAEAPADLKVLRALERLYQAEGRTRDHLATLAREAELVESERERAELYRRLAAEWERQPGGSPRAEQYLEWLLALDPRAEDAFASLERLYRADARWPELLDAYRRHVATAPVESRAAIWLAIASLCEETLGDRTQAMAAYREVERLVPDHPSALAALTRLYEASESYADAIALCERRAARTQPEERERRAELYLKAGELAGDKLGDVRAAEAHFVRALEASPHHVPALLALVEIYRKQGEALKAAKLLVEAAPLTSNRLQRTRLYVEAGEIFENLEDTNRAIALYLQALEGDPEHVDAATRVSDLLAKAFRNQELLPILEMLARKEAAPAVRIERLLHLAMASRTVGELDRAVRAYERVLAIDGGHLEALRGRAAIQYGKEAWAEALEALRALATQEATLPQPERVELHHRLGVCAHKLGHAVEARAELERARALDPTHRPSLLQLLALGESNPQALIDAKKALLPTATREEQVRLLGEIGDLYLDALEDPPQAAGAYRAGLEVQPDNLRLLHRSLELYVEQKAWSQAMEVLERLVTSEKELVVRAKYQYTAGMIYLEHLARFGDAADYLWASLEGDPTRARTRKALEDMLRNHKSWKELARYYQWSLQHLDSSLSADKTHAVQLELWTSLGLLYLEKLGDSDSAIVALEVALRFDPDNLKRHQQLATLYTAAGPSQLGKAIVEHQLLLRADKTRIASYRALKELYAATERPDRAAACARALECIKPDEAPVDLSEGATPPTQPPQRPPLGEGDPLAKIRRPLGEAEWALLRHPDEDPRVSTLFGLLTPVIAAARAKRLLAPLDQKRLVPAADARPFARAIRLAAHALSVPPPALYTAPGERAPVTFSLAVDGQLLVPVFTVGQPLLDAARPPAELLFECARRVAQLRPERLIRWVLPLPEELAHLCDAAIAIAAESEGKPAPTGELAKTTDGLKRGLSEVALNQVAAVGHRMRSRSQRSEAIALAWLQAIDLTASRAGLVLAGDLARSARLLKHEAPPPGVLAAAQRVLDLVWSSVTEELFAVQAHLGLAI